MLPVTEQDISEAHQRIKGFILRTPVIECVPIAKMCCVSRLFLKAEIFQECGSFKIRGALNAILSMFPLEANLELDASVVAHSSGNHASAVALAARIRGVVSYVVVPTTTPAVKVDLVKAYGGYLHYCDPTMEAREILCAKVQQDTNSQVIHPYNDPRVIAGQGTIAVELLEQIEDLDAVVVPVSGGGMISGIACWIKAHRPSVMVIAAEPSGSNGDAADVYLAKQSGALPSPPLPRPLTIADGLQGRLGSNTWPIVRDLVDGVIVVNEEEIVSAMRLLFLKAKTVVEPSGAVGLAAVLKDRDRKEAGLLGKCKNVAVILCGGNVDLDSRGLFEMKNWQPGM